MPADVISFARGAPSADILPHELVREAAARALESDWQRALSYGTGRGHPGLCEWVAGLHGIDPEQVMVTNGSMEAASLLFQHYLEPGDRVIVEQPTYDRTLLLLKRRGVELIPVPLEEDGVDVGAIEAALAEGPVKLAHLITNFHNPAGCTLSAREARAGRRARRRARHDRVRGRPLPADPLRGRGAADDPLDGDRRQRHPRIVVLEDREPGRADRLPGRSGGGDRDAGQARERDLHLAEHARGVDRLRALRLRRPRAQHRGRPQGSSPAPGRALRRARRALPEGRVRRSAAVATSSG